MSDPLHPAASHDWRLDWPTSSGQRMASARLKAVPEDFVVDEQLDVSGCAGGEHLYLRLEKTGDNTEFVARQLAGLAHCRPFDVGFCGLKDRHAITRQWFSVYRPGLEAEDSDLTAKVAASWPVMDWCRGQKKLRRSDHQGNGFEITLTEVTGQKGLIDDALTTLSKQGCPNYFGAQRFGHDGGNLDRAIAMDPAKMIAGRRRTHKKRRQSSAGSDGSRNVLYFSAARSWLFNEVLADRVDAGNWRDVLDGEPGLPGVEEAVVTGPLWGDGGTEAESCQGELERRVVAAYPAVEAVFALTRMKPERRQFMLIPHGLTWKWLGENQLTVAFGLAPGQYATTLLGDVFDLSVNGGNRANSVIQ